MVGRGEEIPRPKPWTVRAADRQAYEAWQQLVAQSRQAADRVWVEMTSDPRKVSDRQHQLRGTLGEVSIGGKTLDQWQAEPTGAARVWYAIDDETRTLWLTSDGLGHPKKTERRRGRKG